MKQPRIAGVYPQRSVKRNITIRNTFGEPTGLAKILAVANDRGCETKLFIPYEKTTTELIDSIVEFEPQICAFSLLTCQYEDGVYIANKVKKKIPDLISIAGGEHPSAIRAVQMPFDFFVIGEGEATFQELIDEISGDQNLSRVKGISHWNHKQESVIAEPRPRITDLDAFPTALRNEVILEMSKYYGVIYPPPSQQSKNAYMEFSRGCRKKCTFCTKNSIWGRHVVFRSTIKTVQEMIKLKEAFNVDLFFFTDLNFTADSSQTIELCREMERQNLKTSWFCMSNIESANEETLNAMKEAGCCKIMYGVESVDEMTLRHIKKRTNHDCIQKTLEMTCSVGILNHLFYMIGFPWETEESIMRQIPRLQNLPGHQIRIGVATPFPGSEWYQEIAHENLCSDTRKFDSENLVYRHPILSSSSIAMLTEEVFRAFYEHTGYIDLVKSTIQRFPQYKHSFGEYFSLLPHETRAYLRHHLTQVLAN